MRVSDSDDIFVEEFLAHHGVKGQKWGVRKKEESSGDESSSEDKKLTDAEKKARAKKVAIGVGALLVVAGAGAVAYQLHKNGKLPMSSLKKASKPPAAVKKVLQEPTSILHTSRGKNKGFRFYQQGGTPDYFNLWSRHFEAHGFQREGDIFEKLPNGMVAAAFADPKGRKDAAGRVIPHQVLVPGYLTKGINTLSDVVKEIWPMLEDAYNYNE